MKKSEKAFTLVETLIMVGAIGIIAIITIVSLRNMRPDKDYMMIRKAYSETAKAVATLANDDDLYPVQKTAYKINPLGKYLTATFNRTIGDYVLQETNGLGDYIVYHEAYGSEKDYFSGYYQHYCSKPGAITGVGECGTDGYLYCRSGYILLYTDHRKGGSCIMYDRPKPQNMTRCGDSSMLIISAKGLPDTCDPDFCREWINQLHTCRLSLYDATGRTKMYKDDCEDRPLTTLSGSGQPIMTISDLSDQPIICNNVDIDCNEQPNNPACSVGGGKGEDDPCVTNPTSCLPNIEIPTKNSANLDTGSPIGDDKTGDTNYTIPNFQEGSRGDIFTNTALPANHPSDMKITNKFAYSFASLFDTKSSSCNSTSCSFVTKDGMSWTVDDNFTKSSKDAIITVDINGKKGPNSRTTGNIDRFRFRVDAGGAINVFGQSTDADVQKAMKALTSRKFRKED